MKKPGQELEGLIQILNQKDALAAKSFFEACIDYQKSVALRLPNMLMNAAPPDVLKHETAVRNEAKKLRTTCEDLNLPQEFLMMVESSPEIVLKALNEIMWRNL